MDYTNKKVLLVGNGINLVNDRGASWNNLLNHIAGKPNTKHEEDVRREKPFTLWFEEISRLSISGNIKDEISKYLKRDLEPNVHHYQLMKLGIKNILTTNYDYNLETAVSNDWKTNHPAKENYYSLFRRNSAGEQNIWHIHGELNNAKSIMLGHDQYSGYMQKIRNLLTSGVPTESIRRKKKPYLSKFASKKSESKGDVETWVDLFLEKDVHIVGFSFDYTENHLWNLLMKKEKLHRKESSIGKVYFHRCSNHIKTTADEARLSILSSLGADIIDHFDTTYDKAYTKCINFIKNQS